MWPRTACECGVKGRASGLPTKCVPRSYMRAMARATLAPFPVRSAGWTAGDGSAWTLRTIRPGDAAELEGLAHRLSQESLYLRFAHVVRTDRIDHGRLAQLCTPDPTRETALVAVCDRTQTISAVARLIRAGDGIAEFALLVADSEQGHGLGTALLEMLLAIGRDAGERRIVGYVLAQNTAMLNVCRSLGFSIKRDAGDSMVLVAKALGSPGASM